MERSADLSFELDSSSTDHLHVVPTIEKTPKYGDKLRLVKHQNESIEDSNMGGMVTASKN